MRTSPTRRLCVALAALLLLAASCHHAHRAKPAERLVITEDEIAGSGAATAYDVIVRLRAGFLRDRGRTSILLQTHDQPTVFLGDQEYGPIAALRNVPAVDVSEIRFYPGPDAVVRFGSRYGGGVIQLSPRNR